MKCLIIFAGLVAAVAADYWSHSYPVQDTPEVAHAKAEHLAAVAAAKHGAHYAPQPHYYAPQHDWEAPQKKWTGPIAYSPGYDKHGAPLPVVDTPEVAAEKSKHFHLYAHGAHAAAAASGGHYAPSYSAHSWAHAAEPAYHHQHVPSDTPEVAAAKAAHFAAHAARHY